MSQLSLAYVLGLVGVMEVCSTLRSTPSTLCGAPRTLRSTLVPCVVPLVPCVVPLVPCVVLGLAGVVDACEEVVSECGEESASAVESFYHYLLFRHLPPGVSVAVSEFAPEASAVSLTNASLVEGKQPLSYP